MVQNHSYNRICCFPSSENHHFTPGGIKIRTPLNREAIRSRFRQLFAGPLSSGVSWQENIDRAKKELPLGDT